MSDPQVLSVLQALQEQQAHKVLKALQVQRDQWEQPDHKE